MLILCYVDVDVMHLIFYMIVIYITARYTLGQTDSFKGTGVWSFVELQRNNNDENNDINDNGNGNSNSNPNPKSSSSAVPMSKSTSSSVQSKK